MFLHRLEFYPSSNPSNALLFSYWYRTHPSLNSYSIYSLCLFEHFHCFLPGCVFLVWVCLYFVFPKGPKSCRSRKPSFTIPLYILRHRRSLSRYFFKWKQRSWWTDTCIKSLIYSKLVFHSITCPFCYPHCEMVLLVKITSQ